MKRLIHYGAYGAAILTVLFALALPIKAMPIFLSIIAALDLKIAPWFAGGEVASVIDRGNHHIKVYHPVYPALVGEGSRGFVQIVWQPRSALPPQVHEAIDLDCDGIVDCEISFSIPANKLMAPVLTVKPRSPWVVEVHESPTTSLSGVLIERVRDAMYVRIPIRRTASS